MSNEPFIITMYYYFVFTNTDGKTGSRATKYHPIYFCHAHKWPGTILFWDTITEEQYYLLNGGRAFKEKEI